MNTKIVVGVIMIALGIISLSYQAITYTQREKVVDLGPLQVSADKKKSIPLPPIAGAVLLVGGVVVIAMSRKS
jgi:uncharacterized membrane protein